MTGHVSIYRDGIAAVAEHVERCIVKTMCGRHCVLVRDTGRIRVCHVGKVKDRDAERWVGTYTPRTPRSLIAADLESFVREKLAEIVNPP
jgi:hypothetical protein